MWKRRRYYAAVAAVVATAALARNWFTENQGGEPSSITAVTRASRASCWAPCGIKFDQYGTSATGYDEDTIYRDALYHWNFDHAGAGTWTISGRSKEAEYGPEAGHIFTAAGTYDVVLTATLPSGDNDTETSTITVSAWGGSTTCFSTSGDFTDCPGGATQTTSSSVAAIDSAIVDDARILLRCGEDWTHTSGITIEDGVDRWQLGTYGSCGNASIQNTSSGSGAVITVNGDDGRITDLDLDAPNGDTNGISRGTADHLTISGVHITSARTGLETSAGLHSEAASGQYLVLADCDFDNLRHNGVYLSEYRGASLLGLLVEDTNAGEHNVRMPNWRHVQISHGSFGRAGGIRHNLKMISNDDPPAESIWLLVSWNEFEGQTNAWMIDVGPMDTDNNELVADFIIEHNWIKACTGVGCTVSRPILMRGRYGTARHNVIDGTLRSVACVAVEKRGAAGEPEPSNMTVYNNTCVRTDGGAVTGISATNVATLTIQNNYTVSFSGTPTSTSISGGSGTTNGNNVTSTDSATAFVDTTPGTAVTDFDITTSSAAYNAGTTPPGAWLDYDLHTTSNGAYDCGAFEYVP